MIVSGIKICMYDTVAVVQNQKRIFIVQSRGQQVVQLKIYTHRYTYICKLAMSSSQVHLETEVHSKVTLSEIRF